MNHRLHTVISGLLCLAMPATAAYAGATLTQDNRRIMVGAEVSEGAGWTVLGPTHTGPGFGDDFAMELNTGMLSSSPSGAADAQAIVSQTSSFDATPVFSRISAEGSAFAQGSFDSFSPGTFAKAYATSTFDIQFTVLTTQTYTVDATIDAPVSGVIAFVRLREVGAGDFIYNLRGSGETGAAMGMLQPGEYELQAVASAAGVAYNHGAQFYNLSGSFDFDFTIVPEPAAGLLMLCCSGVVLRRRRR